MPLEGEKLDELLSGYLDNQLDSEELQLVEGAIRDDESVRLRLEELRGVVEELREFREAVCIPARSDVTPAVVGSRGSTLPVDFASRVISEAQKRAAADGLGSEHHVLAGQHILAEQHVRVSQRAKTSTITRPAAAAALIAAIAAGLLLAVYVPGLLVPSGDPTNQGMASTDIGNDSALDNPASDDLVSDGKSEPTQDSLGPALAQANSANGGAIDDEAAMEAAALEEFSKSFALGGKTTAKYVGDSNFAIQYVFIVDVLLSEKAIEDEAFNTILAGSGVTIADPIVGDDDLTDALSKSRINVPADADSSQDALLYFVHADLAAVGKALENIHQDLVYFPQVRYDLAFDSPTTNLMKRIALSSGERFAVNDSIAAPLAVPSDDGFDGETAIRPSPFSGVGLDSKLIASNRGGSGRASTGLEGLGEGKACVLILVRMPE